MRLEEQRLTILEIRIEADIALGNHGSAVQELEALTREHPFRERLSGFLMVSLYRSGRQADALRVYQRVRAFLGDELGIEPSVDLQRLEDQILTQDPVLDFVASATTQVDRAARGYELREKIRNTPFGVLYRGFQGSVGREVSVLRLDEAISGDPKFVRRFETEMRSTSELEHPHLVPIYDFWRDPDGAYLVTAFPHGGSLRDAIAIEPWNVSAVARLVDQLSSALSFIHRNGFVHGGLGIDSVLLDEDSNAYISDLGLSGLRPGPGRSDSTVDDVMALADVALALLSGVVSGSRSLPSEHRPDLSELDATFQRAWHPDRSSRYQKPEDFRRALLQTIGGDVVPAFSEMPTGSRRNPYKGLRAFKESEAADFHGRDSLIEELTEAIASNRLVAVVGPSGSGKSSLVRAGLLPSLRAGAIRGSENWLIAEMFPGTHPFEELEAALVRVASERPKGLIDELTADDRGLARVAKKLIGNDRDELVVLIDQFEELFSLVSSETNRRLFLDSLTAAATDERSRLRFILTLRADFFDQPLQYPEFGDVLSRGLVAISPPSEEGLTRAIAQPPRNVGVDLQPGLVTRIIDDVRNEPGGLPLMQYALTELFNNRVTNTMTLAAYEESGGVAGALANRADEIYGGLSNEGKAAARNLLLRLVNVDELADDTRRRVRQTELRGLSLNQGILEDVIQQFGAFRLLSFDRDAATRTPTVEVAHEALIREWARLRTWIDDRREDLLIHRRMQVTARDWEDSEKDPSYLLRGSRLEQALVWQERTDIAITDDEMTFIEASIEQEKRDVAEYAALEAKAARRRKAVIGVLVGGLVVAGLLTAVALDRAQSERITAAQATARDLSAAAMDAIEEDPELGILLALEAIDSTEQLGLEIVPEAASAIREGVRKQRVTRRLGDAYLSITYGRGGESVLTDDQQANGVLHLWRSDTEVATWDAAAEPSVSSLYNYRFGLAPDGGQFAVSWVDPRHPSALRSSDTARADFASTMVAVTLHDAEDLTVQGELMGEPGLYGYPSFGANGYLASIVDPLPAEDPENSFQSAYLWEVSTGTVVAQFEDDRAVVMAEFIEGTDTLVLGYGDTRDENGDLILPVLLRAVDAETLEEVWSLEIPDVSAVAIRMSPDGSKIAFSDGNLGEFHILYIRDETDVVSVPHADAQELIWSADGTLLAVSGNDSDITIYDEELGWARRLTLSGPGGSVWGTAFHPDSEHLASTSLDGNALEWDVSNEGDLGDRAVWVGGNVGQFFLGPDPDHVLPGVGGQNVRLIDIDTGSVVADTGITSAFLFDPTDDFRLVSGLVQEGLDDEWGTVFDFETGTHERPNDPCQLPFAISPDKTLVAMGVIEGCETPSQLLDVASEEVRIDWGPTVLIDAVFSPQAPRVEPFLAVNINFMAIEIFRLDSFERVASFTTEDLGVPFFLSIDVDPEGLYLGLGSQSGRVLVLDMGSVMSGDSEANHVAFDIDSHKGSIPQVRVSSDGIALSAGFDGIYRVWNISTSELLFEIREPELDQQGAGQFTWDGAEVAYEDALGNIRFTPLNTYEVVEQAKAVLTRTLTDDECTQYLHTDGCIEN